MIRAGQVKIGNMRTWSDSLIVLKRVTQEKEKIERKREHGAPSIETQSQGSVCKLATKEQMEERESEGLKKREEIPARAHIENEEGHGQIY